jgi:hypothetical protein
MHKHLSSPFFIKATDATIDEKLVSVGIRGGAKLRPPFVGITHDGRMWEMFREKGGWMVHDSGRSIKKEFIDKYFN